MFFLLGIGSFSLFLVLFWLYNCYAYHNTTTVLNKPVLIKIVGCYIGLDFIYCTVSWAGSSVNIVVVFSVDV